MIEQPTEAVMGFVSPVSHRSLTLDPARLAFRTADGGEWFGCVAGEIPDFRVGEPPPSDEDIRTIRARLEKLWLDAESSEETPQVVTVCTPVEAVRYRRALAAHELKQFVRWWLAGCRPHTQRDSMALYRTVTDVFPGARRRQTHVIVDGCPARCPLILFKRLSLEPAMRVIVKEQVRSILDFGCGWGANRILLKQRFPDLDVWSFDYSPERVLSTRFNLERLGLTSEHLFIADGSRLPLADASIDLVLSTHVLEQMSEVLPRALDEIRRVARRFAVHVEPTWRWARWPQRLHMWRLGYPRSLAEMARARGWTLLEHMPANPGWGRAPGELMVLKK